MSAPVLQRPCCQGNGPRKGLWVVVSADCAPDTAPSEWKRLHAIQEPVLLTDVGDLGAPRPPLIALRKCDPGSVPGARGWREETQA
jgi:hypothetical protein